MNDRNVQYPNRYQLDLVQGTSNIYDITPAPGTITEEGTLINKSTLLKDDTATAFGLNADAVPDDVLKILSNAAVVGGDGSISTPGGKVPSSLKAIIGSYVGDGAAARSLTFDGSLKLLIVTGFWGSNVGYGQTDYSAMINPSRSHFDLPVMNTTGNRVYGSVSYNGSTITWQGNGAGGLAQYTSGNAAGETYNYIAFVEG